MPELLKNRYNYESLHELALSIKTVYPSFQADGFIDNIMDETWDELALKARMQQIAINLDQNFDDAIEKMEKKHHQSQAGLVILLKHLRSKLFPAF